MCLWKPNWLSAGAQRCFLGARLLTPAWGSGLISGWRLRVCELRGYDPIVPRAGPKPPAPQSLGVSVARSVVREFEPHTRTGSASSRFANGSQPDFDLRLVLWVSIQRSF